MLQIERITTHLGSHLISAGESLNNMANDNVNLNGTFRILNRISYLEMAIGLGSLLIGTGLPREMRSISYILGFIGTTQCLALLAISGPDDKSLKVSTHVLPLVARVLHSTGNHLAV